MNQPVQGRGATGNGSGLPTKRLPSDDHLGPDGRVMESPSEHTCQGWLEGCLLTGRHGLFSCYEAFIHTVDSMFNLHAKWLKVSQGIPRRRPIASLNYLLASHVRRQDHNGFSHQDPGFIDHVVNKTADTIRVYSPPDANTLLRVADRCLAPRPISCGRPGNRVPAATAMRTSRSPRTSPATPGLACAKRGGGIDVNVTLQFGLSRYRKFVEPFDRRQALLACRVRENIRWHG